MAEIKIPLKIAVNPIKSTFFIFTFYFLLLPCRTSVSEVVIVFTIKKCSMNRGIKDSGYK
jgi:hypothetical protein